MRRFMVGGEWEGMGIEGQIDVLSKKRGWR